MARGDTPDNNIQKIRKAKGLTQAQLAELVGISDGYLSRLERSARNANTRRLWDISTALGVTIRDLVPGMDAPIRVVGYVRSGSFAELADIDQERFAEAQAPQGATPSTVALQIRGADIMGSFFDGALLYYDETRKAPTEDLVGKTCVVGLKGGEIAVRRLIARTPEGRWHLEGFMGSATLNAEVEWASLVREIKVNWRD